MNLQTFSGNISFSKSGRNVRPTKVRIIFYKVFRSNTALRSTASPHYLRNTFYEMRISWLIDRLLTCTVLRWIEPFVLLHSLTGRVVLYEASYPISKIKVRRYMLTKTGRIKSVLISLAGRTDPLTEYYVIDSFAIEKWPQLNWKLRVITGMKLCAIIT